jgi:hypothetical protein
MYRKIMDVEVPQNVVCSKLNTRRVRVPDDENKKKDFNENIPTSYPFAREFEELH